MEALGLAIAPTLTGEGGAVPIRDGSDTGTWETRIFNVSGQFAASGLRLEARFQDGLRVAHGLERLGPGAIWKRSPADDWNATRRTSSA